MNEVEMDFENTYRLLIENLPQRIFQKDSNSVYLDCNQNFADAINLPKDQIIGKTDFDFFEKDIAEKYRSDDKRVLDSGKIENIEEILFQNGEEIPIKTTKIPITDKNGNKVGLLGLF
ncbi:MAG: PAS domain-containing protein [Nitrosopumilaceae archaeon]|jgi:PAS domain S-box-containing protein|uniref:PAS domain-containing protein n=2 Tax=Candidatus Nitrosomaritimum aestuariumsis TaxID=3342354 RepID=A0AC60W6D6_9ARCH|nr:PAS domain-containing protein [Nitrosopumilaceae archaeon]MBA4455003.1 PAS domain-containing protein [Nitrosopumilaceae archaeon]